MCALGGRPKEEGGHKRINISISEQTLKVLKEIKQKYGDVNFSQFVESLIKFYPELEEMQKEALDSAFQTLEIVLDLLRQFGNF